MAASDKVNHNQFPSPDYDPFPDLQEIEGKHGFTLHKGAIQTDKTFVPVHGANMQSSGPVSREEIDDYNNRDPNEYGPYDPHDYDDPDYGDELYSLRGEGGGRYLSANISNEDPSLSQQLNFPTPRVNINHPEATGVHLLEHMNLDTPEGPVGYSRESRHDNVDDAISHAYRGQDDHKSAREGNVPPSRARGDTSDWTGPYDMSKKYIETSYEHFEPDPDSANSFEDLIGQDTAKAPNPLLSYGGEPSAYRGKGRGEIDPGKRP
jgi:hypothetical protein